MHILCKMYLYGYYHKTSSFYIDMKLLQKAEDSRFRQSETLAKFLFKIVSCFTQVLQYTPNHFNSISWFKKKEHYSNTAFKLASIGVTPMKIQIEFSLCKQMWKEFNRLFLFFSSAIINLFLLCSIHTGRFIGCIRMHPMKIRPVRKGY